MMCQLTARSEFRREIPGVRLAGNSGDSTTLSRGGREERIEHERPGTLANSAGYRLLAVAIAKPMHTFRIHFVISSSGEHTESPCAAQKNDSL